jgi:hypothetical protein
MIWNWKTGMMENWNDGISDSFNFNLLITTHEIPILDPQNIVSIVSLAGGG